MSRIRSVHPGLFTDEAWVSCSPLARILVIGLWTDADDQGVFEWKPLQIKMRLLPGDAADAGELLSEIERAGMVMSYDVDGKRYGAIKNFRKFQRPQKPNALHPLPDFAAAYVGLSDAATGPVRDQSATGTVEAQPMEDGGGRVEEKKEPAEAKPSAEPKSAKPDPPAWETDREFNEAWALCTPMMRKRSDSREKTYPGWRRQAVKAGGAGVLLLCLKGYLRGDEDVRRTGGPGFHAWLADGKWEHWKPGAPMPAIPPTPEVLARRAQHFRDTGEWKPTWGDRPITSDRSVA